MDEQKTAQVNDEGGRQREYGQLNAADRMRRNDEAFEEIVQILVKYDLTREDWNYFTSCLNNHTAFTVQPAY